MQTGIRMKRGIIASVIVVALLPHVIHAQAPEKAAKGGGNRSEGMRLFNQSCRVCHVPAEGSAAYAPRLSKASLGGNEQALTALIANGTDKMPGFKSTFTPAEIRSIAAYV